MDINDIINQSREGHCDDQDNYTILLQLFPEKLLDVDPKELGCALWTTFSQNNEVRGSNGKELIEGSWRWWGGYIADYLNHLYGTDFNYLNFYCSSYGLEYDADKEHISLLRLIMSRIKDLNWSFHFAGPKLYIASLKEPDDIPKELSQTFDKMNAVQEANNIVNPPLIVKIAHEIGVLDNCE